MNTLSGQTAEGLCAELKREEAGLSPLAGMSSEVRCVLDVKGAVLFLSQGWEHLYGRKPFKGRGPLLRDLFISRDRHIVQAFLNSAARAPGVRHDKHVRLDMADGREKWLNVCIQALQDEHGEASGFAVVLSDVDDLVRLEERMQASREASSVALQAAGRGIFSVDLENGDLEVSGGLLGDIAPTPTSLEGLERCLHEKDRPLVRKAMDEHLRDTSQPMSVEFRVMSASGEWEWRMISGQVTATDEAGYPLRIAGILTDITAIKATEQNLRRSETRLKTMLAESPVGVAVADGRGDILFCNSRFAEMCNLPQDMLKGRSLAQFYGRSDRFEKHMSRFVRDGRLDGEKAMWTVPGRDRSWVVMTWNQFVFSGRDAILCWAYDITELTRAERKLKELATVDHLTRLFNRRFFMLLARREWKRAKRYNLPLSMIMFDADKFKSINDTFGHDAGDKVLQHLARTSLDTLRDVDILGRLGGEEFGVLLPETGGLSAMHVAERLREAVEELRIVVGDFDIRCTISLGVATLDADIRSVDELMKQADMALYSAKAAGRNQVVGSDAIGQSDEDSPQAAASATDGSRPS